MDPRTIWQAEYHAEHDATRKGGLAASTRLGKTKAACEKMRVVLTGSVDNGLVVCPLKVGPTWMRELAAQGLTPVDCFSISMAKGLLELPRRGVVFIINWNKFWRMADDLIALAHLKFFTADESHNAKSAGSKQGKAYRRIGKRVEWLLPLTGTPAPNHYGELWGQSAPMNTDWGSSYEQFAKRFLIRDTMFPSRILGHRNVEELQRMLLRDWHFVRRGDVFGEDNWQYDLRAIDLPPAAHKMYDTLVKDWLVQDPDYTVDAAHILKRLIRLQQLCSGYTTSELGENVDIHTAKLDAVEADLSEIIASKEKALIFHVFKWESEKYASLANSMLGPEGCCGVVNGETSAAECDDFVQRFRAHSGPAIGIIQIRSGGVGLDFAEATHGLRVSRSFSFIDDEQSINRIWKPHTPRVVTDYRITRSVDGFIAAALSTKRSIHESVTSANVEAMAYGMIAQNRSHK